MWTSTLYLEPGRILLSKCIGLFYPDIYYTSSAPLQVENIPRQTLPSANWVRVRNRLAGICGSDLHLVRADGDLRVAPAAMPGHRRMYPGHEVVGEVIEIGEAVEHLQVGDRVVLQRGANCVSTGALSLCRACTAGNYNLCEQENLPDPLPIGGGWSEEMLLHEQQLFLLDNGLGDEQGMLIEPTAVALHAVLRRLPRPGEQVLIIGAGTIGLLTLQVVQALAPLAEVTVLARHPFQVELARRMGAAQVIYPRDSYRSAQRITGGRLVRGLLGNQVLQGGFSVVYDTVGRSGTLHDALRWTRGGGTVVLIGVDLHLMHIDLTPVWYREINLLGSMSHGVETWPMGSEQRRETFSIVAELMQQGVIHPEQLITHRFALSNYREALQTAGRKSRSRAIKVAFDYALQPATAVPNLRASARRRYPLPARTMTLVPDGGERVPLLPTMRSSQEVDEGRRGYSERDGVNQEIPTALPAIKRGLGDEAGEAIRSQGWTMEAVAAEEETVSVDESVVDDGTQPTLKFAIPRQFLRKSAPPPTSGSPAIEPRDEPELIILTGEDGSLAVASALAALTEGQESDIAEKAMLEMRASELAARERGEAVAPAALQVDQGEAQDIAESETVLDLAVPKVEAEPDIAESETVLMPTVADSETAPVLVVPGVEVASDGETESVHVVQPEEQKSAEVEVSAPFEATAGVEQVELTEAELSEPAAMVATEVVGVEPGTGEAGAVSSIGEDAPVESLVGQEIIKEEAREAIGDEMVAGEVEGATGKEIVTDEKPAEGMVEEVSACTQTASSDGSGKTLGKRAASRRPRKKAVVAEGVGENMAGEQEKVAKIGDSDTNSTVDTLPEVERTPTATATPKPRSRRKKTKPSA